MFKLESYITPILFSYVDKYIKNFRPEDSQVSLWGGDATFHNLDLRLDVLEDELQLPFNLVSGHIHELLIHVPWTKLASEPINITINTIECVLKLRGTENPNNDGQSTTTEGKRKQCHNRKQDIAAPPGYVQSLISKIVNNISINCNNLILKYVEEDIVVSVNIKLLTFQSADESWHAAYTELSPTQMIMRKLITLSDLTVCLDKRNAAGKIEVYQEPVLYRCSVEIRLLRNFQSSTSDKALNTRLDFYCNRMEFSMTEQQIPMLMRMINLLLALHQRQLKRESNSDLNQSSVGAEDDEVNNSGETWTGWAWSIASTIFPSDDDNSLEWSGAQRQSDAGNTLQLGVYIDHAIFTFKVSEYYSSERGYYATRKLKYWPLLCLQLNGCFTDTVVGGAEWCSVQMGIAEALLMPQGCCSCGIVEIPDDSSVPYYLNTGVYNGNHKLDSLFDPKRGEHDSSRNNFRVSWDYYICTVTEDVMLEKTPAFAIDYLYHLELPEEFSSEQLSELGSDLEYSNLPEKSICRMVAGPLVVHVCSGLIHRASTLHEVMKAYEYAPYTPQPTDPELSELHPPTEDDFDALNNAIPSRIYQITLLKPVLEFHLMDHPKFVPTKGLLFRRIKKSSNLSSYSSLPAFNCPHITVECETLDIKMLVPVYPKRLVYTTCQLPDPPTHMFNACYKNVDMKISGLSSQMIFNANKHTTILLPLSVSCKYKSILYPKYWINPDTAHEEVEIEIDSITLTATKAKLMVLANIIESLRNLDSDDYKKSIFTSSLLHDASRDSGMVVLEMYGEQLKWRNVCCVSTVAHSIHLNSIKAFVLGPSEVYTDSKSSIAASHSARITEPDQALIISGPERSDNGSGMDEAILFMATVQYPKCPEERVHPSLLYFNLAEIKVCVDPLLFQWFLYNPKVLTMKHETMWNQASGTAESSSMMRQLSEASSYVHETPRRSHTPYESVHSSSERELNVHVSSASSRPPPVVEQCSSHSLPHQQSDTANHSNTTSYDVMLKWYPVWTNMIVYGDCAQCTIFFPTHSLSAVGSQGIEDAVEHSLAQEHPPDILVIKLPDIFARSAVQRQSLSHYVSRLPVRLPANMWQKNKESFPWSIGVTNLYCYTLQNERKLYFLKPVSGNATFGLSVKYKLSKGNVQSDVNTSNTSKLEHISKNSLSKEASTFSDLIENINSFSICVYIDNTPVVIALSEVQVCLMTSIIHALLEVSSRLNSNVFVDQVRYKNVEATTNIILQHKSQSNSQSAGYDKEEIPEAFSEGTPTSPRLDVRPSEDDVNGIKCTIWIQWTVAKLRVKLYACNIDAINTVQFPYLMPPTLKLVFDLEDIMLSLDLQQVYTKFKLKIVTASVNHFKRKESESTWESGVYLGTVMRGREELPVSEKQDDFGFLSITVTRAKCGHVHSKWGASKKYRLAEMKVEQQCVDSAAETRYITEVVTTLQPIDLIISPKCLKHFYMVLEPILTMPSYEHEATTKVNTHALAYMNNTNLPLIYLDCNGIRMLLLSSELIESLGCHDMCIIEIDSINLIPSAENPICRAPVRPDIYQQAAQNRILNVPGSDVEDRQYQLNINALSVNTGSWSEFSPYVCRDVPVVSALHTMNENPALEWNNLGWGRIGLQPHLSMLPIIQKFNQCIVIAPAIVCDNNILVCGCSVEVNYVTDIEINVSLHQFRLIAALLTEAVCFAKPVTAVDIDAKRPKFTHLNRRYLSTGVDYNIQYDADQVSGEFSRDSGVEMADRNSEITTKTKGSNPYSVEGDKHTILKYNYDSKSSELSQYMRGSNVIISEHNALRECPVEILVTGGQVTILLYDIRSCNNENGRDAEAPAETLVDDVPMSMQNVQPLLYISFSQPNAFVSQTALKKKMHFSCFDMCIRTNGQCSRMDGVPTRKDYPVSLLETKSGIAHPDTGIPPAFLSVKWTKQMSKSVSLDVHFGRPMRMFYCWSQLNQLLNVKEAVLQIVRDTCIGIVVEPSEVTPPQKYQRSHTPALPDTAYTKYATIKNTLMGINDFHLKIAQVVFVFKTKIGLEMIASWGDLESFLTLTRRPEKLVNIISLKNVAISTNVDGCIKLLLNPWSCKVESCLFWESWQSVNSDPQVQLSVVSDCVRLDVGPEQLKCVAAATSECNCVLQLFSNGSEAHGSGKDTLQEEAIAHMERDQYYKDDLRAGAFQFVDAATSDTDELPLPYQVVFWNGRIAAMAWRYPQPRILTKVRVFPVPFKLSDDEEYEDVGVLCSLEYWSECHGCYRPHAQFHLSESEMCHLDLAQNVPQPAVSCAWRVVLNVVTARKQPDDEDDRRPSTLVPPRALAACMRVDSYFNPVLIPKIQLVIKFASVAVSVYNQFNKNLALVMPETLRGFTPDGLVPDNQCFLVFNAEQTLVFLATWHSDIATVEFRTTVNGCILDYASLTMRSFLEPVPFTLNATLAECVNLSAVTESVCIKFSPAIGHTLAISTQLWTQNWQTNNAMAPPPDMVIVTRYVVCNDTNVKLRFGQVGTDEDILLPSRFLHLYCWRSQRSQRKIRVGIEGNGWIWSKPLNIDAEKTEILELVSETQFTLIVTVKALSTSQKQIIFSGQLIVCNMLLDHFELRLKPLNLENKPVRSESTDTHIINGKCTAPSFLIDVKKKCALRLRFLSLESAWSGDIPLEENSKCFQPWLVKIPLQERGQFLSIWCRIIVQKQCAIDKILVVLWPLFMIRSNLPLATKVQIETPALHVRLDTTIRGRGELQQLYCPGTTDHSHNLAFQFGAQTPGSDPIVPLNYNLIDQKEIFKKFDKEDIDNILEYLKSYDCSNWPYVESTLEPTNWIVDDQPLTHVQVRYRNTCKYSSSLLVEVLPWCLLLNTLGLPIKIIMNGEEVCRVKHRGIVTPPKLEETFNIAVQVHETWYISPLLQLARPDWSQSFYMPKINGFIPLQGSIKVPVQCEAQICLFSISSRIFNEIRILELSPCHVVTNFTQFQLKAACFLLPDNNKLNKLPNEVMKYGITLEPNLNEKLCGIPMVNWYCVDEFSDSVSNYSLHVVISLTNDSVKSCPIGVDKNLMRKNICLYSDAGNIPLLLITQEEKGQILLSIHHDIHPQLLIKNQCAATLFCAQHDSNSTATKENQHLDWVCTIVGHTETYYTMPSVSDNFPNIDDNCNERLVLAAYFNELNSCHLWSHPINISIHNEQYVRIPEYGDVKLSIRRNSFTVIITVDSVTEVEISAQDIRSRLMVQANSEKHYNSVATFHVADGSKTFATGNSDTAQAKYPLEQSRFSFSPRTEIVHSDSLGMHSNWPDSNIRASCVNRVKMNWNLMNVDMILKNIIFILQEDIDESDRYEQVDIMMLVCDTVAFRLKNNEGIKWSVNILDIQCDNQLFYGGSYDFPVVFVGDSAAQHFKIKMQNKSVKELMNEIESCALITIDMHMEMWVDDVTHKQITEIQSVKITLGPLLGYIEDKYIVKLMEYFASLTPTKLVTWSHVKHLNEMRVDSSSIGIAEDLVWNARQLAKALVLRNLSIEPLSVLLSIHSSVKLYIALDRSPLQFARFERKGLITTPYRLGHALTMHYVSGAIFGAGWVVGSLELLGSPGGLARTLGIGLRDFISLPYHGLIQGPWAFLVGITHGSASLMRHVTAGTLDSVTKLAASVARNLDRMTLDEEHQRRTDEQRRQRPHGLAQGLLQGLTGLGISLLGAVGGIAHHPLQSVMNDGASPRALAAGVGLGLVGVITKPLSGAAELVALTGQGLLYGVGWNLLPAPRTPCPAAPALPNRHSSACTNSTLKYKWKFLQNVTMHTHSLTVIEAIFQGSNVVLMLTSEALVVISVDEDNVRRVVPFTDITAVLNTDDPTLLRMALVSPVRAPSQSILNPNDIEMDPVSRARVADYVRNSSGLLQMSPLGSTSNLSDIDVSSIPSNLSTPAKFSNSQSYLTFHVNPANRNYFCQIFIFLKQQNQSNMFKIL